MNRARGVPRRRPCAPLVRLSLRGSSSSWCQLPRAIAVFAMALFTACGYRPLYGGEAFDQRFGVVARGAAIDGLILAEIEAGARSELARAGRLGDGGAFPRIVIEIADIDISGVAAGAHDGSPLARGNRVTILAAMWLEEEPALLSEREVARARIEETVAVTTGSLPLLEALNEDHARRNVARALGGGLARRLLLELNARTPM